MWVQDYQSTMNDFIHYISGIQLTWPFLIETLGVALNLVFLVLLIKRHIACWAFGILGSALGVWSFIQASLYAEAFLFGFYGIMGFYGWWMWHRPLGQPELSISEWNWKSHLMGITSGLLGTTVLGYFLRNYTDAALPWHDAFSTIFSFIATWLEARKILSGWIYWLILNGFSVWLYSQRELHLYALLALVYAGLSVYGWFTWRAARNQEQLA